MTLSQNPPKNPIGPFEPNETYSELARDRAIEMIRLAPDHLRSAVQGLSNSQLDTKYKNWTIRQITHHIADSHLNSLVRFKWTLTEDRPVIKAYEEGDWVGLSDAQSGDVEPALALLTGIHAKWVQVLRSMTEQQYSREFLHPQTGDAVSLWTALNSYAWHGRHHTGQIQWLCEQNGWS